MIGIELLGEINLRIDTYPKFIFSDKYFSLIMKEDTLNFMVYSSENKQIVFRFLLSSFIKVTTPVKVTIPLILALFILSQNNDIDHSLISYLEVCFFHQRDETNFLSKRKERHKTLEYYLVYIERWLNILVSLKKKAELFATNISIYQPQFNDHQKEIVLKLTSNTISECNIYLQKFETKLFEVMQRLEINRNYLLNVCQDSEEVIRSPKSKIMRISDIEFFNCKEMENEINNFYSQ